MMKYFFVIAFIFVMILPQASLAQTTTSSAGGDCGPASSSLCNPIQVSLGKKAIDNIPDLLRYSLGYIGALLGFISIITIVYAGIRMIGANGNEATISKAKQTITYSIIGFVLAVLAYAGVAAIENLIGLQTTTPGTANTVFNPFGGTTDLKAWLQTVLQNVMGLTGILAVAMLVINGFRYATARGDEKQVSKAKNGIYWSLIGLVIIIFAYVIVKAIANLISK